MMRLPTFAYYAPDSVGEAAKILRNDHATIVAGGTDLWPNMKRRQVEPKTVVTLRKLEQLRGIEWRDDGTLRIGPTETLRAIERDPRIRADLPALWKAVVSISTPSCSSPRPRTSKASARSVGLTTRATLRRVSRARRSLI